MKPQIGWDVTLLWVYIKVYIKGLPQMWQFWAVIAGIATGIAALVGFRK